MVSLTFGTALISVLLSTCFAVNIDQLPLYAKPIRGPRNGATSRVAAAANLTCAATDIGPKCGSDCRTFLVCDGNSQPAFQSKCTDMETNEPYCVGNTCSATPDPKNSACQLSFQCTCEGVFPDPSDCTTFHYCSNIDATAMTFHCPSNYYFDLLKKTCVLSSKAYCYTIDCSTKKNKWAVMPGNPAYYAFCGTMQTIMYRCEDTQNYFFNPSTNQCQFNCLWNGNFEDRTNCTQYISCNWQYNAYQITKNPCPPMTYYNSSTDSCAFGNCTNAISTPAPPTTAPSSSSSAPGVTTAPPPKTPAPNN